MWFWSIVGVIVAALLGTALRFGLRRRRDGREGIQIDGTSIAEARRVTILTDPATVTGERYDPHHGGTGGGRRALLNRLPATQPPTVADQLRPSIRR